MNVCVTIGHKTGNNVFSLMSKTASSRSAQLYYTNCRSQSAIWGDVSQACVIKHVHEPKVSENTSVESGISSHIVRRVFAIIH